MVNIIIQPSSRKEKKYDAIIDNKKTVSFGASGYQHFTDGHKDEKRKENYIKRHGGGNQNWKDYTTPAFWSRWFTWEKPTMKEAEKFIEKKFNLNITNKIKR